MKEGRRETSPTDIIHLNKEEKNPSRERRNGPSQERRGESTQDEEKKGRKEGSTIESDEPPEGDPSDDPSTKIKTIAN